MNDKLCVSERRFKIVDLLIANGQMTRRELAQEFNVKLDTISRDIMFLSSQIPLYTKTGASGGIFILNGYKGYSYYFDMLNKKLNSIVIGILQ